VGWLVDDRARSTYVLISPFVLNVNPATPRGAMAMLADDTRI
jgi:hypothetical protein